MRKIFVGIGLFFLITYTVGNAIPPKNDESNWAINNFQMTTRRYPRSVQDSNVNNPVYKREIADADDKINYLNPEFEKMQQIVRGKRSVNTDFNSPALDELVESPMTLIKQDQIDRLKRSLNAQDLQMSSSISLEPFADRKQQQIARLKRNLNIYDPESSSSDSYSIQKSFAEQSGHHIAKFKRSANVDDDFNQDQLVKLKRSLNAKDLESSSSDSYDLEKPAIQKRDAQIKTFEGNVNLEQSDIVKVKRSLNSNKKSVAPKGYTSEGNNNFEIKERAKRNVLIKTFDDRALDNGIGSLPMITQTFNEQSAKKIVAKRDTTEIGKCETTKVNKRSICKNKIDDANEVLASSDDNNNMMAKREINEGANAFTF